MLIGIENLVKSGEVVHSYLALGQFECFHQSLNCLVLRLKERIKLILDLLFGHRQEIIVVFTGVKDVKGGMR